MSVKKLLSITECLDICDNLPECDKITESSNYYQGTTGWLMPDIAKKYLPQAQSLISQDYTITELTNIYVRTYHPGCVLKMHTDQARYDVTMTVCVENTDPDFELCVSTETFLPEWPFGAEPDLKKYYDSYQSYDLRPGDAVSMQGRIYPHWRPEKRHDTDSTYIFYSWQIQEP